MFLLPEGLLWGAGTSGHQVEGNNRWSDWWMHEQAGRLPHRSGEACHHYEMYEADFDLARSWGHNAHRFSIEWSRIERRSHILGYLYWSLMDNFEGALGRGPRFGLAEVDFETQRRIPRPAAEDFATVCRSRLLRLPEAEGGGG